MSWFSEDPTFFKMVIDAIITIIRLIVSKEERQVNSNVRSNYQEIKRQIADSNNARRSESNRASSP